MEFFYSGLSTSSIVDLEFDPLLTLRSVSALNETPSNFVATITNEPGFLMVRR